MALSGIIGGVLDIISPTAYMDAYNQRGVREEGIRANKASELLQNKQFDLGKMMAMQQYRANEEELNWKRRLRDYMGGVK